MNKIVLSFLVAVFFVPTGQAREIAVTMHALTEKGVDNAIGVVVVSETQNGLRLTPHLSNMQPGEFWFTINENIGCHSEISATGFSIPGMAAGNSIMSLPLLKVANDGTATAPVEIRNMSLAGISKRSLVISRKTGPSMSFLEGTERVACGSLELY